MLEGVSGTVSNGDAICGGSLDPRHTGIMCVPKKQLLRGPG